MSRLTDKLVERHEKAHPTTPANELEATVRDILHQIGAVSLWPKMRRSVRAEAARRKVRYEVELARLIRALVAGDFPAWALREPDPPRSG